MEKTKTLFITIAGKYGSSRSTMMYELEKLLKSHDFDVEIVFDEKSEFTDINDFHNQMIQHDEARFHAVKKNVKIVLKTVQLAFESH